MSKSGGQVSVHTGRHFLQIPGPTNVPDRVLRAMAQPTIDHRGPEFGVLGRELLNDVRAVFKTTQPVVIFPASGTGAWEAALVNTLSPGDTVLMAETGQFASLWEQMAKRLGLVTELQPTDWRHGADPAAIEARLARRRAPCDQGRVRRAQRDLHRRRESDRGGPQGNRRGTPPGAAPWSTRSRRSPRSTTGWTNGASTSPSAGSQKGLMLPPGLSFNAVSEKALAASKSAKLPRAFWGWDDMLKANKTGYFPYTPATNLLYGLREALAMLAEEGLENVFARHTRHGEAARRAVRAWGLEVLSLNPAEHSGSLTAVVMPAGHDADALRARILDAFDMSLGTGLGKLAGKVFQDRPSRPLQRPHACGHARGRRDGSQACAGTASGGRAAGCARLPSRRRGWAGLEG